LQFILVSSVDYSLPAQISTILHQQSDSSIRKLPDTEAKTKAQQEDPSSSMEGGLHKGE